MLSPEAALHLNLEMIRTAHERIASLITRTPVMTSSTLDARTGARLFFKCENLQKAGAFKARGATNAVFSLSSDEAAKGVVTHSSGNHAAAVSRAAQLRRIPASVVMPRTAPKSKQAAVQRYGGRVIQCEPTQTAREETARLVMEQTGGVLIHAYDDLRVMAGQGTTAVEFLAEVPNLDVILCSVGGGGHLSGIGVAAKSINPGIRVLGVEPSGADDAARSLRAGRLIAGVSPASIADGLLTSLSEATFSVIRRYVDDIVVVTEEAIVEAMRTIWEVMKLIVEPSGAVAYAAVGSGVIDLRGKRVGIVLSGGNLDLDVLPWQQSR
jgi:threonine dehydratase